METQAKHRHEMATDRPDPPTANTNEFATAIGLFLLGEISLGKAAERVGLSRWEMQEFLEELGIDPRQGPQSLDDLQREVDVAIDLE